MKTLSVGDLIIDNIGRVGLVYSKERPPSAKWLAEQEDVRIQHSTGPWWKVLPLDGGAIIVPAELATFLRRASVDDLLALARCQQNEHAGTATLVELFERLSAQRQPRGKSDA